MNKSRRRICGSMAVGAIIALVIAAPASATLLVDFTIETDKDVYQTAGYMMIVYHVYNAGNEGLTIQAGHFAPAAAWLFENADGLSRDELLSEEQPVWTRSVYIYDNYPPLSPGETLSGTDGGFLHYYLGGPIAPGQYSLLGVEGPYPEYWGDGVTVDYSNACVDITIVPEPGTLSLLAGLAAAGLLRKARRRMG